MSKSGYSVVVARKTRRAYTLPGDLVRIVATGLTRQQAHSVADYETIVGKGECVHVRAPGNNTEPVSPEGITYRVVRSKIAGDVMCIAFEERKAVGQAVYVNDDAAAPIFAHDVSVVYVRRGYRGKGLESSMVARVVGESERI